MKVSLWLAEITHNGSESVLLFKARLPRQDLSSLSAHPFDVDVPVNKKPSEELNGLLSCGRVLTNAEWREALVAIYNGLKAAGQ